MADLTPRRRLMVGVALMAAAVGLVIFDAVRVSQAWRLLGSDAVWATGLGGLGIIANAGLSVWAGKDGAWARSSGGWRAYRWAVGVWAVALVPAFCLTHSGSDPLTSNLSVGVATYTGMLFALLFFSTGARTLWPRTKSPVRPPGAAVPDYQALASRTHDFANPDHRVEIWHVHLGRDEPDYYVAHCDCDWVGTAYDTTEPGCEQSARREADYHSKNAAKTVVEI